MLTVEIEAKEITERLNRTIKNLENPEPMFRLIGKHQLVSTLQNFEAGGRPSHWKALKAQTILGRMGGKKKVYTLSGKIRVPAARKAFGHKPLIRGGTLRDLQTFEASSSGVRIGSNVPYAQYHQFGTRRIPARPFLIILPSDESAIHEIEEKYISEHLR
jgi:phage virion morphogenesis protein